MHPPVSQAAGGGQAAAAAEATDGADAVAARASSRLAQTLNAFGFRLGRLKTGTPPRLDGRTIDYSGMMVATGDAVPSPFSFLNMYSNEAGPSGWAPAVRQVACRETYTSEATEALVNGCLAAGRGWQPPRGIGAFEEGGMAEPRYCPSLETKFRRFPGRRHHVRCRWCKA